VEDTFSIPHHILTLELARKLIKKGMEWLFLTCEFKKISRSENLLYKYNIYVYIGTVAVGVRITLARFYIHDYEGVAEAPQILLRDAHDLPN
jgi:hypothetical protein